MRTMLAVLAIALLAAVAAPRDANAHRRAVHLRPCGPAVAVRVGPAWLAPRVRVVAPLRPVWRPRGVVVVRH
jgi:hypothetical protein